LQRLCHFPLLARAIPHHIFRKLPAREARKVGSNLRNRADHAIMPVNQLSSFRRFHSANYFPHSAFPQITFTPSQSHAVFSKMFWKKFFTWLKSVF